MVIVNHCIEGGRGSNQWRGEDSEATNQQKGGEEVRNLLVARDVKR